jgi:hypothetical protein
MFIEYGWQQIDLRAYSVSNLACNEDVLMPMMDHIHHPLLIIHQRKYGKNL